MLYRQKKKEGNYLFFRVSITTCPREEVLIIEEVAEVAAIPTVALTTIEAIEINNKADQTKGDKPAAAILVTKEVVIPIEASKASEARAAATEVVDAVDLTEEATVGLKVKRSDISI